MPSRLHEDLLRLFQNRPALAAELAREALHMRLSEYREARVDSVGENRFRPWVLSPAAIPEITDEGQARSDPELAILSAMAHLVWTQGGSQVRLHPLAAESHQAARGGKQLFPLGIRQRRAIQRQAHGEIEQSIGAERAGGPLRAPRLETGGGGR